MTTKTLRTFDINGSDLTGSNGATNRTYSLPYASVDSVGLKIWINGMMLHPSDNYTLSGSTITFLGPLFDSQVINGEFYSISSETSESSYGTPLQLVRFMGIAETYPNIDTTTRDSLGTGDNSTTRFWVSKRGIIEDTFILSYGASESSLTTLTADTDYELNLDNGLVTLTASGVTKLGTDTLYAEYTYNILGLTNQQLSDALERAEKQIDHFTNNHFVDHTATTPDWNQHLDEVHDGKGFFDRNYFGYFNYPIPSVSTTLDGAVTADDATITVASTDGFPDSGTLGIGSDKITYSGKTATTFTGCSSVSAHDDGDTVVPYVFEISTTDPAGTISWDVLTEGTEYELQKETGRFHLYADGGYEYGTFYDESTSPPRLTAKRVRCSYLSGYTGIPKDIVKATLMLASKDLMNMAVRRAHSGGLNDFDPTVLDVDMDELNRMLKHYRNEQVMKI